jgi:PAS domain S-box-containing protein
MPHNRRVLIVDDQRAIHDDFRKLLEAAPASASAALEQTILGESPLASVDYEIESAYQGEAGLEAVRHARTSGRPFALAIVDARMPPGWDGLLTVEKIFEADAEIQGVICTAYSDTRWHDLQRRFGVSDRLIILKKPFDPAEACQLVAAMTEKWNLALKRRQAMQALLAARETARESEKRFRLIANTAPVMIWMSDVDHKWTFVNQRWLNFTGRALEATLGHHWIDNVHPDDIERVRETYTKAFERRESFQTEYQLRRHDGEFRCIASTGVPRFDLDGSFAGFIGSALDITERKRAEEVLSTLSQRLIDAQEGERTRLARELHDDINQRLGLLVWHLDHLAKESAALPAHLTEQIACVREEVVALGQDVQALSHRLHPARLVLGLEVSAAALCREVIHQQDMEINFQAEAIPASLSPRLSLCLYRILQEGLQNVIKHSGVRRADVSLCRRVDQIELIVRDAGKGFDVDDAPLKAGLGLTSMQERLKAVDGQMSVDSTPGLGTTIRALVPLR